MQMIQLENLDGSNKIWQNFHNIAIKFLHSLEEYVFFFNLSIKNSWQTDDGNVFVE